MTADPPRSDRSSSPSRSVTPIENGAYPFPLTDGPSESPYLVWVRNHSNYMATQGLLDYLRALGVLVRGIIVNFLIFLPYLLAIALVLAFGHHWMLAHPYRLTLLALAGAALWVLVFPAALPLFTIVRYSRSLQTGSESTLAQRNRYEQSFGLAVLAVIGCAALESMPRGLEYLHDTILLDEFGWSGGLATILAGIVAFSGADKLLAILSGAKRVVAMVLIGALGVAVPLLVVLYVADFLLYGLPPSPAMMFSPLVVPAAGVVLTAVALPLGYWRRAFTTRELLAVSGILAAALAVLALVIAGGVWARGARRESLDALDKHLGPLRTLVSRLDMADGGQPGTGQSQAIAPEVAGVVRAFVAADRTAQSEDAALQSQLRELREAGGRATESCGGAPQASFVDGWGSLRTAWGCWRDQWRLDARWAQWDARYFSVRRPLVILGHRLSEHSDERLAPLRQRVTSLARADARAQIAQWLGEEHAADLLRRRLVERFLESSAWEASRHEAELARAVAERFADGTIEERRLRRSVDLAKGALRRAPNRDIAALVGEPALFRRLQLTFQDVPGRAEAARLAGPAEMAALLTTEELIELVFDEHARAIRSRQAHRRWLIEDATPAFPRAAADWTPATPATQRADDVRRTHDTAMALARLADAAALSSEPDPSLAFYVGTRTTFEEIEGPATWPDEPTAAEIARAAGARLARRALDDLDVGPLIVLAFAVDQPIEAAREGQLSLAAARAALPAFLAARRDGLASTLEEVQQDESERRRLDAFLDRARRPLAELAALVFPAALGPSPGGFDFDDRPRQEGAHADADDGADVEGLKLYQWPDRYATRVLLAAGALGHDVEGLSVLARETLAERLLLPTSRLTPSARDRVLDEFALFNPERLTSGELAAVATAHFGSAEAAAAEALLMTVQFGRHGPLKQPELSRLKRRMTEAVLAPKAIFVALLAIVIWLGCWLTVDVNLTSAHSLYRDRLASAFLVGRDSRGDIGIEHDVDLDDLSRYDARATAPYHLINVALNLQGSADPSIRDRQSDFFIFSKRFVGSRRTGYCRSETLEQVYPQMSVATAMAISAAAASPNMGRATSPFLVAFMTLLNVRLGYWMPNPGRLESDVRVRRPRAAEPVADRSEQSGFGFGEVFAEELAEIERRWRQVYPIPTRSLGPHLTPSVAHGLVGIAFSGGGIRSAALNLGITQALDRAGLFDHIDYMSTVSGGGYVGSSLSTLMRARERLVCDVAGTAAVERTDGGQRVTITTDDPGALPRTYRFTEEAVLNVRHGDRVAPGRPLLKPPAGRRQSDVAGTVSVTGAGTDACTVTVSGDTERRDYRFTRFDVVNVRSGDTVRPGQDLVARRDTLGERFRWRVRPAAFLHEMLGRLDERHAWVNVSDGGHIENLGVIELLRRRCKFIIIGDGEADPEHHLSGLATLMRYALLDLGISIDLACDGLRLRATGAAGEAPVSEGHWAVGTIRYPASGSGEEAETGFVLYLKSSVSGDEGVMGQEYRHRYPDFPHQMTADQFFDEDQFEAYRSLGQHIAESALEVAATEETSRPMTFGQFEQWFERLGAPARMPTKTS